jgi:hypothetical protein
MDLKDFIAETLTQISGGIAEAQKNGNEINPSQISNISPARSRVTNQIIHSIDFDVAIFANEGTEAKANTGITVASFLSLGASGKSNEASGTQSRIKFSIPMSFPSM